MKNNYAPVSDSDDSFKVLNDEKSDARSLDGTGTPPPYSAPNKFIDLEMADGSTQHSAQESTNNAGSDSTYSKWIRIAIFFFLHLLCILYFMLFFSWCFLCQGSSEGENPLGTFCCLWSIRCSISLFRAYALPGVVQASW
ncbi:uncharacterized protein SOCG_03295 [Schizosaccharomyces octosporus yFS286]|uniref:Uncharacterized protein n=1 Tax=Schizosaccharomyces octosporus (strain yFS286) TaxID=483514 RepID=S9PYD0_SCHOY|nr:uncharacterized protein SOCG_03295 [Schizosaccharomyces octosporus yFS286]EPX74081.1 hypothetical protein SOCG_03295 [Schizosaccharomyces octosporus yFS286]